MKPTTVKEILKDEFPLAQKFYETLSLNREWEGLQMDIAQLSWEDSPNEDELRRCFRKLNRMLQNLIDTPSK